MIGKPKLLSIKIGGMHISVKKHAEACESRRVKCTSISTPCFIYFAQKHKVLNFIELRCFHKPNSDFKTDIICNFVI